MKIGIYEVSEQNSRKPSFRMQIQQNCDKQIIGSFILITDNGKTLRRDDRQDKTKQPPWTADTVMPRTDCGNYPKTPSFVQEQKASGAWDGAGGGTTGNTLSIMDRSACPSRFYNTEQMTTTSQPHNNNGVPVSPSPFVIHLSFTAATSNLQPSFPRAKCKSTTTISSVTSNRKSARLLDGDLITHVPGPPLSMSNEDCDESLLKDYGKNNSSNSKSATMLDISLNKLLECTEVTPAVLIVYVLSIIEGFSEQICVRIFMTLPPEQRDELMRNEAGRLHTFRHFNWRKLDAMPAEELAAAETATAVSRCAAVHDGQKLECAILPTVNGFAAYYYQPAAFTLLIFNVLLLLLRNMAVACKASKAVSAGHSHHLYSAATVPATALNFYGISGLLNWQAQKAENPPLYSESNSAVVLDDEGAPAIEKQPADDDFGESSVNIHAKVFAKDVIYQFTAHATDPVADISDATDTTSEAENATTSTGSNTAVLLDDGGAPAIEKQPDGDTFCESAINVPAEVFAKNVIYQFTAHATDPVTNIFDASDTTSEAENATMSSGGNSVVVIDDEGAPAIERQPADDNFGESAISVHAKVFAHHITPEVAAHATDPVTDISAASDTTSESNNVYGSAALLNLQAQRDADSSSSRDTTIVFDSHSPRTFNVPLITEAFSWHSSAPIRSCNTERPSVCTASTVPVSAAQDAVECGHNACMTAASGDAYSSSSRDEPIAFDDHCPKSFNVPLISETFSWHSTGSLTSYDTELPSACMAKAVTVFSDRDAVKYGHSTCMTAASGMTSLSVNDKMPPADCEPPPEKCIQQEVQPYFKWQFSSIVDGSVSGRADTADFSFNTSCQPENACDLPCFLDDCIALVEQEDDAKSFPKDTREDIMDSSDIKSAMRRCLSLHKLLDFSVVPPPLLIYTLHSSDSVSEQDYVRNLMALPPEEREALMKSEAQRLRTYGSGFWPIREVMPPEELAAAGFYYTGVHDRVQCAFCRGVLRNWERGDSAMNEHRVHFSYCRLVMGLDCGNVPIASGRPNGENASAVPTRGGQANLFASTDRTLNDVPDNTSFANLLVNGNDFLATMGSGEPLPGVSTEKPKHPEHAVEARRLQSFSTWPSWALQSPENLAKAGFYYAGFGDSVKCFYCDGGLRNWEIMDNPWEEHARWFNDCKYLLDVKGKAYVDEIQKKYAVGNETARLVVTPAAVTSRPSPVLLLEHPSVQLVKSLGYSENQVLAALERFYPQHQTGPMPKGAELLDAVLQMEDESSGGPASFVARPALGAAGRSLPTNEAATSAVAASRPSATASVPPRFDRQRPEPDGISSGPNAPVHSSRAAPDVKRPPEPPPLERPLASLHDIIFTGLLDLPDGEARFVEENRQMHKHLECKGCRQRPAEVVLLPCGHFSSCLECVPSLRNCPVCATVVRGTIRTYLC